MNVPNTVTRHSTPSRGQRSVARAARQLADVQHELGDISAALRYFQAFGDRQELDASIFSLMGLEARLALLSQSFSAGTA